MEHASTWLEKELAVFDAFDTLEQHVQQNEPAAEPGKGRMRTVGPAARRIGRGMP